MRKARDLVQATKPFAREQRLRSWWHLWSTLAVLGGLLTVTCLDVHWLFRLVSGFTAGLVLVRLFIIYHDYQHGSILRGSWLAEGIMWVYGMFTLNPPSIWNHTHNRHHKTNAQIPGANIGTFPLMTTRDYARAGWLQRLGYIVARHPLTIVLGYFTVFFYSLCLRSLLARPLKHFDSGIALLLQAGLVVVLAVYAPLSVLLLTFLLPWMVGACLGAYLFYAQHNFPGAQIQDRADWDYAFAALKSSSYMSMNWLMRWFTGNIGYHHVHHLNAHIPFYRLPEAMAAVDELQSPVTTSLHPVDIYRCLRLKLWDPDQKRMVSFRGT
jgi:omega-6 fatty acid desaturase (delta-12 desaturase)